MPRPTPPTLGDLIRAFLADCLEPAAPTARVPARELCATYARWSRWQSCAALTDANLLHVVGAITGQIGHAGPIEELAGHAFKDDPLLEFLMQETRLRASASVSVGTLHHAYVRWLDAAPRRKRPGSFHGRVSALIGRESARSPGPAGAIFAWRGLALDNGLPEAAVAPFDPTDAASLRALPLDAREVA
ncbi:hypothetical protein OPKNFCMD_3861 [Methylobacterium crusticola]|uniref:Core-binding (CB) domain-containing protein n=1 Tax=Methylobacterium crusticola TaxID=1697972 RepID=A0ABQ4R1U6_9HYPH|nr:hypothetical protein [Methylobacterium crusticola]GJD51110.1 hypothetical protein OPKNFCMD_3861 [Methylobacterium crusticola]